MTTTAPTPARSGRPSAAGNQDSWALLMDGDLVRIRSIHPADRDDIERLHAGLSADSRYLRFFGFSKTAPARIADRISRRSEAVLALGVWWRGELVGVAHCERSDLHTAEAEVAFVVADALHGKGVGTLLLEHLASAARAAGIRRFVAEVLNRNSGMIRVFADAGLRVVEHRDQDVMVVVAFLDAGQRFVDAVAEREGVAQAASLGHIFAPDSVVVVGASERSGNVGGAVVRNLQEAQYAGDIGVVHPRADQVFGAPCWRRLADVPFAIDLAVLAIPVPALGAVIDDCGRHGVRAVVVLTSGVDARQGRALRDQCRRHGMRLVGPNCLGVSNPSLGLNATFAAHGLRPGGIGVAVQSGGVGIALAEQLAQLDLGISSFVSLGDKYDVSATDMLQLWHDDEATDLAVLYVESYGNPRKFARVAKRLARQIPVLAVDGGRSAPAQRAALSHTAAAATPSAAREALFSDAGVIAVSDLADLVSTVGLLAAQPLPASDRVAVISNAGGAGVLAADACVDAGLQLPELSDRTRAQLAEVLPIGAAIDNPVDAGAGCDREALAHAASVLAADPHIDAVLALPVPTGLDDMEEFPWRVAEGVPVLGVRLDQAERLRSEPSVLQGTVPVFGSATDAARSLARVAAYARWRETDQGEVPDLLDLPGLAVGEARELAHRFLAENPEGGWLDPLQAREFIATAGLDPIPLRLVDSAAAAAAAVREFDGPVALKAYGPGLVHKHHAGGVVLNVRTAAEAEAAFSELAARHGSAMIRVIVQPMVSGDLELLAGVSSDPVFGPIVAFGLGGTEADALADRAVRLAPLTNKGALGLLRGIRAARVLDQAAAGGPVDQDAIVDLLLRIALLSSRIPQLADLDLNPVLARRDGIDLVDVKVRLLPRRSYDHFLRRLR